MSENKPPVKAEETTKQVEETIKPTLIAFKNVLTHDRKTLNTHIGVKDSTGAALSLLRGKKSIPSETEHQWQKEIKEELEKFLTFFNENLIKKELQAVDSIPAKALKDLAVLYKTEGNALEGLTKQQIESYKELKTSRDGLFPVVFLLTTFVLGILNYLRSANINGNYESLFIFAASVGFIYTLLTAILNTNTEANISRLNVIAGSVKAKPSFVEKGTTWMEVKENEAKRIPAEINAQMQLKQNLENQINAQMPIKQDLERQIKAQTQIKQDLEHQIKAQTQIKQGLETKNPLSKKLEKKVKAIEGLNKNLSAVQRTIKELNSEANEVNTKIADLEEPNKVNTKLIADLELEVNNVNTKIAALEGELEDVKLEINENPTGLLPPKPQDYITLYIN